MRKEIERLKRITAPATQTLNRLKNAQQEQQRISTEQLRKKQMIDRARTEMSRAKDENAYKNIEQLLKNNQKSIARLEATKKLWKEVEKRQIMGALSALSLIDEPPSQILQNMRLPVIKSRVRRGKRQDYYDFGEDEYFEALNLRNKASTNDQGKIQMPITIDQTIEAIGELGQNITSDEKRAALRGKVSDKIVKKIQESTENQPTLDGTVLVGNSPSKM